MLGIPASARLVALITALLGLALAGCVAPAGGPPVSAIPAHAALVVEAEDEDDDYEYEAEDDDDDYGMDDDDYGRDYDEDDEWDEDDEYGYEKRGRFRKRITLTFAGGTYEHNTSGSSLDDSTDGGYSRLQGDFYPKNGIGGGFAIEGSRSDDKLFEDQAIADTEGHMSKLFVYFAGTPADGKRGQCLLRFGPFVNTTGLETDGGVEIQWDSFGLQLDVEPEVYLLRGENADLSAFARLAGGYMLTSVDLDSPLLSESFDTEGILYDFDVGLRGGIGIFDISVGYFVRTNRYNESDDDAGLVVLEAEAQFRGVGIEFGVDF